jgi:hypothetical protein
MIRIRVPLKIPYKNQLTPSPGLHSFRRFISVKKEWERAIPEALDHQRASGPRRIRIVRLMTARERPFDTGNLIYSAAAIIDIVVAKGYLVNDNPELTELATPVQRESAHGDLPAPATYIEIEELPGPAMAAMPALPFQS